MFEQVMTDLVGRRCQEFCKAKIFNIIFNIFQSRYFRVCHKAIEAFQFCFVVINNLIGGSD